MAVGTRGLARKNALARGSVRGFPWCNQRDRRPRREAKPQCASPRRGPRVLRPNCAILCPRANSRKRYADRIGPYARDVPLPVYGEAVPLRERFDRAVHGLQKIVAVRLNVKANEIGAEKTIDQLALPRTDSKNFRVRPGNVPEDRHARVRPG